MLKFFHIVLILALITSCGQNNVEKPKEKIKAKGEVKYGGVFKVNETEEFRSLYPPNITEVVSHRIANQVYEGLVKLDQEDLSIILPSIAEKWEINDEATRFTFYLRKGVKFHDNPCFKTGKGRLVTANDFKFCLDRICAADALNQTPWLFKDRVKGANEYYESTINKLPLKGGVSGIKVIDDYTLEINLNYPFAGFINIISHISCSVYPKEAVDMYGEEMRVNCVGTGPFQVNKIKEAEMVSLKRNPNYWKIDAYGNKLPYLDGIKFSFIKDKKAELLEFKKGNLDMVFRLPLEMINDVVVDLNEAKKGINKPYEMQVVPAMSVFYLGFQNKLSPFNSIDVRKAFNYALDKEAIVNYTLKGEGRAALYGVVPPFKGYNYEEVKGYEFSVEKAKKHLKDAGYPNGKGFPTITLQINPDGGDRNLQVATVVQKMLAENLGVKINIDQLQLSQHLENIEEGKALFWRAGWLADYPDPESFLNLLFGEHVPEDINAKSFINTTRYQSNIFDKVFNEALREPDTEKRMELYRIADQIAINDAAMLPVFYDEITRLLQIYVKNFPANAMEYRDMTAVYFDKEEK